MMKKFFFDVRKCVTHTLSWDVYVMKANNKKFSPEYYELASTHNLWILDEKNMTLYIISCELSYFDKFSYEATANKFMSMIIIRLTL